MPKLRFYFDYTDPASHLVESTLRKMGKDFRFPVVRIPFEENPPPLPLLDAEAEERIRRWNAWRERFDHPEGQSVRPWIVPWTRKAHELAAFADEQDCFPEIHESLFRAYLSEGLDIGRIDVLVTIAKTAGLDPMETKAALDVDQFSHSIAHRRSEAIGMGVARVPTLLLGGRRLEGLPTLERLTEFLGSGPESET